MTIEQKIQSAQIAALNDGYLSVDRGLIIHYLEESIRVLNASNTRSGDPDLKELIKAVKQVKKPGYPINYVR